MNILYSKYWQTYPSVQNRKCIEIQDYGPMVKTGTNDDLQTKCSNKI